MFCTLPLRSPFLGYFDQIIQPAAAEMGLVAEKGSDLYGTRAVISDIWDQIWKARIAISIVTGKNPNVNYELGICHTLGVPTILLTEKEQDVPFDYRHRRFIHYKTKDAGWEQKLREDIVKTIRATFDEKDANIGYLPWPYDTQKLLQSSVTDSPFDNGVSRQIVAKGIAVAQSVVEAAFGPDGIGISLQSKFGPVLLIRSGSRILSSINIGNPLQLQGVEVMRQIATDMQQREGDLTKTAMLMASEMITSGERALGEGVPLKALIKGIEQASDAAANFILGLASPVSEESRQGVALTASRDSVIASLVARAIQAVGEDGLVEVLGWDGDSSDLTLQEGLQFSQGYLSPDFVREGERDCILENAKVLIFESRIDNMASLLPLLEIVVKNDEPLLVISSEVTGEALSTLLLNHKKGTLNCVAVKSPGLGDSRRNMLQDIAVITGGTAILQEQGVPLSRVSATDFGSASRISISSSSTTIVGGSGDPQKIRARVDSIRNQIASNGDPFALVKLRERLARLVSGIATVRIGGRTESERTERLYAATSAYHACLSSRERGAVPGGGISLMRTRLFVRKLVATDPAEMRGIQVILNALAIPQMRLIENSAVGDKEGICRRIFESDSDSVGFNSDTGQVGDLIQDGILDSARSLSSAIHLSTAHAKAHLSSGAWTRLGE